MKRERKIKEQALRAKQQGGANPDGARLNPNRQRTGTETTLLI